ncbi:hypothetical protein ABZ479_41000 [Streptomyces sp. NPDC005722]
MLGAAIEKSGADLLEVGGLLVSEPLPQEHRGLRNGAEVRPPQAMGLAEGMAAGHGPYCQLAAPGRLQFESGWDGAVHLYTTPAVAADLAGLHGEDATFLWQDAAPEPIQISDPVDAVADTGFWARAAEASECLTLVCERWAHGVHGCRWFHVTPESTAEVARLLRPRSLVCVAVEPELNPRAELLQDAFTTFVAPLPYRELVHRNYPSGADTLSEVTDDGFSLMLADAALGDWCAVVPDTDGVAREQWESPGVSS